MHGTRTSQAFLIACVLSLAACEAESTDPSKQERFPMAFIQDPVFDPPESCSVLNDSCYQAGYSQCFAQSCFDENAEPDPICANATFAACIGDVRERCTNEETPRCGDCRELEARAMSCSLDGEVKVQFNCNETIKSGYEEMGLDCTLCQFVRVPGQYKSCRCGPDILWREFCPEGISTESPFGADPCDLNPSSCVSTDAPSG